MNLEEEEDLVVLEGASEMKEVEGIDHNFDLVEEGKIGILHVGVVGAEDAEDVDYVVDVKDSHGAEDAEDKDVLVLPGEEVHRSALLKGYMQMADQEGHLKEEGDHSEKPGWVEGMNQMLEHQTLDLKGVGLVGVVAVMLMVYNQLRVGY